jgi:DUF1680 family protein
MRFNPEIRLNAILLMLVMGSALRAEDRRWYRLARVPAGSVQIADGFWEKRLETNRRVTIPFCIEQCERTGRIENFVRAAAGKGEHQGYFFNDSDVFKVIEGAARARQGDEKLDRYLDDLIAKIAAAQQPDGYLNTYYTLKEPGRRWTNLKDMHELYCAGHLMEAAVQHYYATGKRTLLDVAVRLADHIVDTFGPDKRHEVCGHEEVEIGLVSLYKATADRRYLDAARFFVALRGRADGRSLFGEYCQDHETVAQQRDAVGHAVRAGYLYCAMADMAALGGDTAYLPALDRLWDSVVGRKMYLTGGIGARRAGEAFGDDYELPNASAYSETCAAIAKALWNHRMLMLRADAKYADVLERVLYNGVLPGVSMEGDRFFYPNPLAWDGKAPFNQGTRGRAPWFACACCPVNVVRFMPQIPEFVYCVDATGIFVNLYMSSDALICHPRLGNSFTLKQQTRYPWDGRIRLSVDPAAPGEMTLRLRIPGWAAGSPVPGDLYSYSDGTSGKIVIRLNGEPLKPEVVKGFAVVKREWKKGDCIELDLPMPVRRVKAHPRVRENTGRVALERGPLLYCIEAADHEAPIESMALPDDASLVVEHREKLLGGVSVIRGEARVRMHDDAGSHPKAQRAALTAIPYFAWNHRAPGAMAVWLPRDIKDVRLPPIPTLASKSRATASHCYANDSVEAMNDQIEPKASGDQTIPRFTWWSRRGTTEWVQYELPKVETIRGVEVYWFDDTGAGYCRVPASWRVMVRRDGSWEAVKTRERPGMDRDRFNAVTFDVVQTDAVRLEVSLQEQFSGGILEWRLRL